MSTPAHIGPRERFFELLFHIDHAIGRARRALRGLLGIQRPLTIVPFRGYGTPERACVSLRVQEKRWVDTTPVDRQGWIRSAINSYRRYATVEMPGATVRVRWAGRTQLFESDEEGFVEAWIEPASDADVGGLAEVELVDGAGAASARTRAPVQVMPPSASFGVISDIDDTVIETGVPNLLRRWITLFLTDTRVRLPFEGVAAFYAALRAGATGAEANPLFYVSSSPWNLYRHLEDLFERHEIPAGPILLRDWGLSRYGFAPGGGHGHKLEKMEALFAAHPDLSFLLLGDSGQEDAAHYTEMVRRHPGRVLAIYIRAITADAKRIERIEELIRENAQHGVEMLLVEDTVSAAQHAAERGWIREEAVAATRRRELRDHLDPEPESELLSGAGSREA